MIDIFSFHGTNCCGWHTWDRWEQYELKSPAIYKDQQAYQYEWRQRRRCIVCNKEQDQLVRQGGKA